MSRNGLLAVVAVVLGLAAAAQGGLTVADVVGQVSQANYQANLDGLLFTHNGDNRGVGGPDHDPARANIYNAFEAAGLSTSMDPFMVGATSMTNVVGVYQGKVHPQDVYIVGAHYDSASTPGADDNASGVAGVLEAARVLTQYQFDATIVFVAFDAEEWGLYGSNHYATEHSGDNIRGMISLDMIAYNPAGAAHDTALIYGRDVSGPIKNALADSIALYGGGITSTIQGPIDASDHAPFEWQGFQACLLIEGAVWSNPNYHQQADSVDTPGYIDYAYATAMTRGAVGYLATSALLAGPLTGDTNYDGLVDVTDLDNVYNCLGEQGAGLLGDCNHDGVVDMLDLKDVYNNLGQSVGQGGNVPEPATLCLFALGILAVRRRRTRHP